MDSSRFPSAQSWSASQLDQLRKFLQTASRIPSTQSIHKALRSNTAQSQPSLHGQNTAGKSAAQPSRSHTAGSASSVLPVPDGYSGVKYPAPDVNSMIFDVGTGYRFDQRTGLYYDANAGLFINKQLNVLLKWNPDTNTYTLVGRASDIAAPALAQDLARLVRHAPMVVGSSAPTTAPVPKPAVPSPSRETVGDAPFRRERILDFEEMSPEPEEAVSRPRSGEGKEQSPDQSSVPERRRSLSFDEMTPERDIDEALPVSVFPRDSKSPSPSSRPRRDTSLSPRRWDRRSPVRRRSPDGWRNRRRDRNRSETPSPPTYRSRYSEEPTGGRRRVRRSPLPAVQSSWRRNHYSGRGHTSRYRQSSRSRSPSARNRNCPIRRSQSRSSLTVNRYDSRRSRSRSPSSWNRNHPRRSPSRSNYESSGRSRSRRSVSPLGGRKPGAAPTESDMRVGSRDSDHSSLSNDGSPVLDEASSTAADPTFDACFSRHFMVDNLSRIHKANLRNPKNIFGRLLPPQRLHTNFIMLTPLPPKGDREWDDLEVLIHRMLKVERVNYMSVAIYPGDGGAPCNYCLVRFKNAEDAFRWYVVHEGTIDLSGPDGSLCTVFMNFIQNNWKCGLCRTQNFALRHFCYKCFWYKTNTKQPPFQTSQLVTEYVGLSGLDCRFLSVGDVLAGLPPLHSFNIDSFEIVAEPSGIPLGLCVFGFKDQQESAAFYRFLQESCLNPVFVKFNDRKGLEINTISGESLKKMSDSVGVVPNEEETVAVPEVEKIVFPNPPENDVNDPHLWWQSVEGYVEGGDIMKYLFELHPAVNIAYESAPAQVMIGPLPLPVACDLMEYRNLLSRLLQSSGVEEKFADNTSICRAHHFGGPYNFSFVRFITKHSSKTWLVKNEGKLVFHVENGSTWTAYLHYSKPNWQCSNCNKLNFPIRIQCFSCYKARLSDHTGVTIKKTPTNCVGITGFRNWCATEELLFKKLPFLSSIKNLTVSYLREPTGVPLGICVLKSPTPGAAEVLFNKLQDALANEIARASVQDPNRPLLVFLV